MKIAFLISTLMLATLHGAPQAPASGATVEGIVRNAQTREPVAGVEVALKADGENAVAAMRHAVRTDSRGSFVFKDVAPGRYSLLNRRSGHLTVNHGAWWESEVRVERRQRVDGIIIELLPGGSISGRVLAADGEPIVGTQVTAAKPSYLRGVREMNRGPSAQTDEQGRYRIFGLPPGEYYLQARYTPVYPGLESTSVSFPGTFDENAAKPVVVPAGAELTGLDFVFPAPRIVPTYTITGAVTGVPPATDRDSTPTVRLVSRDPRFPDNSAKVRANGQFQIRGVRAGMYDLYSSVEDDKRVLFTSKTPLEVLNNIEGLQLTLQSGVEVRVRITVNGVAPNGAFEDEVPELVQLTGVLPSYYSDVNKGDKNSGEYVLPHVPPGQYQLKYPASLIENGYIADIKQNGRSIFDDGLTVGNRAPDPVEIAIAAPGGIVEAVVRDSLGDPAARARLVLVPLLERRNNQALFYPYMTDEKGEARIRGVAPGTYKAFAWADPPFGEPWWNAEFMAQYEQRGEAVQVEANRAVSVRVTVIPKAGP